jgi:glucokinase
MAAPIFAGIDVGGQTIKLGLVTETGHTLVTGVIPTEPDAGPADAAERSAAKLRKMCAEAQVGYEQIARVGLATPGPMDIARGMLLSPGNLRAWWQSPVRDLFSLACQKPVRFANDANAAAFGEYWAGAARDYHSMVMITLGTGVGGGIVIGDLLVEGAHSNGAEIGHNVIDLADDAPVSTANVRGALEAFVGSYGVVRRAKEALVASKSDGPLRTLEAKEGELTPLMVAQAAEAGDPLAWQIIADTAKFLAIGMVTMIHTIDPESVVIGGAMTFGGAGHPLGERFLATVRDETNRRVLADLRGKVHIDFATLGSAAGYIGAAGLARRDALRP